LCESSVPAQKDGRSNAARRKRSSPIEPAPAAPNLIEPTLDERTMAILAHMLQIVGLWIAPLIIFVIKRESRFVSFHALQALLLQVLYMFLMGLGVVFWFGAVVLTMVSAHSSGNSSSPPAFFIFMPMLWLDWMSIWGAMVVIAIVYGVKAGLYLPASREILLNILPGGR